MCECTCNKNKEFIEFNGKKIIPKVMLLGKSLNEIIEHCNDPKNKVGLIDNPKEIYDIAMFVKENKDRYPELYDEIFNKYWIWSMKITDNITLDWDFGYLDGPYLYSYRLPSYRFPNLGALFCSVEDGK